jgi:putative Holliday junction resolvase
LETFARDTALERLVATLEEFASLEIVVGLPLALSGKETASTQDAKEFAAELATRVDVPIRLIDERLSTVQASAQLRTAGRSSKKQRSVIDQAAAVILLQHALDSERSQGVAPGYTVVVDKEKDGHQ